MARSNKTRFPGLLKRVMRKSGSPRKATALSEKFRRVRMPSGTIYECRPDGWRWVGFKV
jgi:hypothetical protein